MLSGTTEVDIDEDELLEELDALQTEEAIKLDFAIPAAPKATIDISQHELESEQLEPEEDEREGESEREAELA